MNCWNCLHKVNWVTLIVQEDAEEYERESETVVFVGALLALLAMLVWLPTVKVWFE